MHHNAVFAMSFALALITPSTARVHTVWATKTITHCPYDLTTLMTRISIQTSCNTASPSWNFSTTASATLTGSAPIFPSGTLSSTPTSCATPPADICEGIGASVGALCGVDAAGVPAAQGCCDPLTCDASTNKCRPLIIGSNSDAGTSASPTTGIPLGFPTPAAGECPDAGSPMGAPCGITTTGICCAPLSCDENSQTCLLTPGDTAPDFGPASDVGPDPTSTFSTSVASPFSSVIGECPGAGSVSGAACGGDTISICCAPLSCDVDSNTCTQL